MKFTEGESAPMDNPKIGEEYTRTLIDGHFFHVIYYITDYTIDDVVMFSDTPLQYGLFSKNHCPSLVFRFKNTSWSFETHFNILLEPDETAEIFIRSTENQLSLILIDTGTNLVKAIRRIDMPPEIPSQIRTELDGQKKNYRDPASVQLTYNELGSRFAVETKILVLSQKNRLFTG